jgi:hypothetical protein
MRPKVLIYDYGTYCYLAQRLTREFSEVIYYTEESSSFPKGDTKRIGEGIKGVRKTNTLWEDIRKLDKKKDLIFFPDCYNEDLQIELKLQGYAVCGSGKSAKMETDRIFFREQVIKSNLPVGKMQKFSGVDATIKYLKDKKDKYLKTSMYRGDFETYHFVDMDHAYEWFNDLRTHVGHRAETIEILVFDPIDAVVEVGFDGLMLNGEIATPCIVGYEIKDEGYVCSVQKELPKIMREVNKRIAPAYKSLGYNGPYSTELRIAKGNIPYFTDPCCRCGYPPSGAYSEMMTNFGECLWRIARNEMPRPKYEMNYGAEIIFTSQWNNNHWLHVSFPKEIERFVKLKTYTIENGKIFCIPAENSGYFGSVVAIGKTIDEAMAKCLEYAGMVQADELKYGKDIAKKTKEAMDSGVKIGIKV